MSKSTGDFFVDKVAPLLRMLTSDVERERLTALNALLNVLANAGLDFHAVADRVENPGYSEDEMHEICEKLKQRIYSEADAYVHQQIEQQRAAAVATPPTSLFGGGGVSNFKNSSGYSFDDSDRVAGDQIYNGCRWRDIAGHCAANLAHIPAKHRGFIEDMASKLAGYRTVSGAQAKYLGNLFNQYLSGRI